MWEERSGYTKQSKAHWETTPIHKHAPIPYDTQGLRNSFEISDRRNTFILPLLLTSVHLLLGHRLALYKFALPHNAPPSIVTQVPLQCPPALLAKYTTAPAISSGRPSLRFGFCAASFFSPPCISISPLAILLGKNPGAIELQIIWRGPSSTARFRVR